MADELILVVDDHPDNRDLLARRLQRKGYRVETASGGAEALEAIAATTFQLVLLDIMMPGMNGLEVLETVRKTHSAASLPIIMASAETESASVVQALELGANDYITKPIDFPIALARVQTHLRSAAAAVAAVAAAAEVKPAPLASNGDAIAPGAIFDQRYRLDGVIGEGGFAVVYRGEQLSTGQPVAIKSLRIGRMVDPERIETERGRFELEMRLIAEINHPSVVRLLDSGSQVSLRATQAPILNSETVESLAPGSDELPPPISTERKMQTLEVPYIVMELLEGETLADLLYRRGALDMRTTVDLIVPVISGVGAAHIHGAIHRDLKPANIFLAKVGSELHPKVLDFGIAKVTDRAKQGLTADAMLIGTPEYMAPEQARGTELDHRCDQYTLAAVIFECLTGQRPYRGKTFVDLVRQVAEGDFPSLRELSPGMPPLLEMVLARATRREALDRYPTVEDFGLALLPLASESVRAQWSKPLENAAARTDRTSREDAMDEGVRVSGTVFLAAGDETVD